MQYIVSFIFMLFVIGIPWYGLYRRVDIFALFSEGVKDGVQVITTMLPFILGMYTAVRMLRASGFFDNLNYVLSPLMIRIGIPVEILPLLMIRPFSGSASNGIFMDLLKEHGPESLVGIMGANILGSTETALYIITFYFGSLDIKKIRYTLVSCLLVYIIATCVAVYSTQWAVI